MMSTKNVACIALYFTVLAGPALAQDTEWDYRLTIYGWLAGLESSIETPAGTVDADLSTHDVLSNLDMALMTAFEARRGRWGFIADLVYADISVSQDNPVNGAFSSAAVEPKLTAITGLAAYRIHESDAVSVDFGAGYRYVSLNTEVRLSPGVQPGQTFSSNEDWFEPVIAVRLAGSFNQDWYGRAYADVGGIGGGDGSTWQALALVGYRFNPTWSAEFGYRHMHVENTINGNDLSIDLSGPMLGISARF